MTVWRSGSVWGGLKKYRGGGYAGHPTGVWHIRPDVMAAEEPRALGPSASIRCFSGELRAPTRATASLVCQGRLVRACTTTCRLPLVYDHRSDLIDVVSYIPRAAICQEAHHHVTVVWSGHHANAGSYISADHTTSIRCLLSAPA
jgi:hypothetical protein